jgi:thioredoxin-like negative regulator of GroEL
VEKLQTFQQFESYIQHNSTAIVIAVIPAAVCKRAVDQIVSIVPEHMAIATVDINENSQFQSHFTVTVAPTVYVFKNAEIEAEFVLPFDKEQILCALKSIK